MDKTILNLLFSYKGSISYREFRAGSIILFMLTATILAISFFAAYSTLIIGRVGGAEQLASYVIYRQVIWPFIPALVPAQFIIAYSSFILAVKRMRTVKRLNRIASGIINFLFYAAIISSVLSAMQLIVREASSQTGVYQLLSSPIFIGILLILIAIGLTNFIYSAMRHKYEVKFTPDLEEKKLDVVSYVIKNGNIMAVMGILSVFVALGILVSFFSVFDEEMVRAFAILFFIMPLVFYIRYSIYRMNDAGISLLWLIAIMGSYIIITAGYVFSIAYLPGFFYIFTTIFEIATAIFVFGQYILLLLPTKKVTVTEQARIPQEIISDFTSIENKEITAIS